MKKVLSVFLSGAVLLTFAGCSRKDSLYEDNSSHSTAQSVVDTSQSIAGSNETSEPELPEIPLQKISELRRELEDQVKTVKNTDYANLHFTDDLTVKIPDSDTLYDLTFKKAEMDFKTLYEKFDKIFDNEFGDIYTEDDKEKLYQTFVYEDLNDPSSYYGDDLAKHFDDLMNGEDFVELSVNTDKAYLCLLRFGEGAVHELFHDGIINRAKPDEMPDHVAFRSESDYFEIVKNYLNVDSGDRYEILDAELSVKEAAEMARKITTENGYSWGGSLEPDVYQVKVIDIGEGKYGFSFTLTPSYKGVRFDSFEFQGDGGFSTRSEKLDHNYDLYMPTAFIMESGKFERFSVGDAAFSATEDAEIDSVISFEDAVQILSDKFGTGMNLQVSRAELMYSGMYPVNEGDNSVKKAFPVWKFKCHNTTDNLLYFVYINAVNGSIEYYVTDWWEI